MSKDDQAEVDRAISEFVANGGKITQCVYGKSGRVDGVSYSSWSKKKPSTSPLANPPEDQDS